MTRVALLCIAAVLACAGCTGPQPDRSATRPTLPATTSASGPRSALVCDGASAEAVCVKVVDGSQLAALETAFLAGPRDDEDCPGLDQQVYRIVFTSSGGEREVDVPAACGPTLADARREVTDDERELVRKILPLGPDAAAAADFIGRCVGGEEATPAREYVGLGEDEATRTKQRVSAGTVNVVRVIGRDGECLGRSRERRDDRVNLLVSSGNVVWAGRF